MDQQVMLEKTGVPAFYVTNKGIDLRLQMVPTGVHHQARPHAVAMPEVEVIRVTFQPW